MVDPSTQILLTLSIQDDSNDSTDDVHSGYSTSSNSGTHRSAYAVFSRDDCIHIGEFFRKGGYSPFEKLAQWASLDNWSEEQTLNLLKFKLVGEAYSFFKSEIGLDVLSFTEIKVRFIKTFLPIKLPEENLLNLSKCFQRHDGDISSFCIRLHILGAKILKDALDRLKRMK
ncbi:hypothetical protein JTB14_037427 [Gonioctena quinquepunctata]|nr:hypothetical protein JTB14_037427 [Gonioctena quinquepunctata]